MIELGDQRVEERLLLRLARAHRALGRGIRQRASLRALEPLVAHQQHGLREIERGEFRIDRKRDDAVGKRDLVVGQPPALAAEQDRGSSFACDLARHLLRRRLRRQHRLCLVVRARRGREHQRAVGDRRLHRVEQSCAIDDGVGAGGRARRVDVRPAVARIDDAEFLQAEVAHRARGHADVLAELRLDQHDDRRGRVCARTAAFGSFFKHSLIHFGLSDCAFSGISQANNAVPNRAQGGCDQLCMNARSRKRHSPDPSMASVHGRGDAQDLAPTDWSAARDDRPQDSRRLVPRPGAGDRRRTCAGGAVLDILNEAVKAANACHDEYGMVAVLSWPLQVAFKRGRISFADAGTRSRARAGAKDRTAPFAGVRAADAVGRLLYRRPAIRRTGLAGDRRTLPAGLELARGRALPPHRRGARIRGIPAPRSR